MTSPSRHMDDIISEIQERRKAEVAKELNEILAKKQVVLQNLDDYEKQLTQATTEKEENALIFAAKPKDQWSEEMRLAADKVKKANTSIKEIKFLQKTAGNAKDRILTQLKMAQTKLEEQWEPDAFEG